MSDRLYPLKLEKLLSWILTEEKTGKIFGYHKELFFTPKDDDPFKMERYDQWLDTPIGVAAGPHTQLSQNIILAWLFGARYIELKTVQTLDEIEVSKPCIDMIDEGYNCEWSQELKIRQSFDEYLNAWILIHILKDHFDWVNSKDLGCIFNMSVGYDLKGILNDNVHEFLNLMNDCSPLLEEKLNSIEKIYPRVKDLKIPSHITDNITLSTMHGCPPDEIEKIGKYLIEDKELHTTVKLNPTLIGPERLRQILNDDLNFKNIIVPDEAFEHDLKYTDAIPLINNLANSAEKHNVDFGLKLTNTLEVLNSKEVLPPKEATNYMSGRALHPISINLAAKLQNEFNGELDISFSAGADAFNITDILACNIKPVTTCTDVLKPGGYGRLKQYVNNISKEFKKVEASSIDDFIIGTSGKSDIQQGGLANIISYSKEVVNSPRYQNQFSEFENIKTERVLTEFDCIEAPCIGNCATDQNIPQYIYHTAKGEFDKAFNVIMETNAMPGTTGAVCDQLCAVKCTRNNYDNPLLIRDIKRYATDYGAKNFNLSKIDNNIKVGVIGAGPAGLAAAYYLAKFGCKVKIFEANDYSGGMVYSAIPKFRLEDGVYLDDLERIKELGVEIEYKRQIDSSEFKELQKEYNYVFIGVGAQETKKLYIDGEELDNVIEPVEFLSNIKQDVKIDLGNKVAIIGGGNTAMDAARTAKRIVGNNGDVVILYRRTRKEMPAEDAEIQAAIDEGIELVELVAPLKINGTNSVKSITCQKMQLSEPDESGRAKPIPIPNSEFDIKVDIIIPAIGQNVVLDFIPDMNLETNINTGETNLENVFAGGDAVRGASTVVDAIGDGKRSAYSILNDAKVKVQKGSEHSKSVTDLDIQKKVINREYGISVPKHTDDHKLNFDLIHRTMTKEEVIQEADRCLYCDEVCSMCVYVCPNLANMSFKTQPIETVVQVVNQRNGLVTINDVKVMNFEQSTQIINIADFCNECGNCTTFCPTDDDPYKTKPIFYLSEKSFKDEDNGYLFTGEYLKHKDGDSIEIMKIEGDHLLYSNDHISAIIDRTNMRINVLHSKVEEDYQWDSQSAVIMGYLLINLEKEAIFTANA